jgi:glycosyltransferase involved in cell wall biosynthesis
MNTIHITIQAYNAEKTLRRAVDSVLTQTYKNFVIYVCDNGSTDNTRAIVNEYAEKELIKPYYNEKNLVFEGKSLEFLHLCENIPDDDFYAALDADDELYPEFFEKLINFALENNLDIAKAGYDIFNIGIGKIGTYEIFLNNTEKLIFEKPEDYRQNFIILYNYSWAIWGGIYRGSVSGNFARNPQINGVCSDTQLVLKVIKKSRRIGILPEQLMLYYVNSGNSVMSKYDKNRRFLPETFFCIIEDLLLEKTERKSPDDQINSVIFNIYFSQLCTAMETNLKADISDDQKLSDIIYLINGEHCREFYRQNDWFKIFAERNYQYDIFTVLFEWIHKNLKSIHPHRVRELYHLFFDVIYSAKLPKFLTAEIDFLLQFDIRVINSILCGVFAAPAKLLEKSPDSDLKNSVLMKINQLESIK